MDRVLLGEQIGKLMADDPGNLQTPLPDYLEKTISELVQLKLAISYYRSGSLEIGQIVEIS